MEREFDLGLVPVAVKKCWAKVRIPQYSDLALTGRHEDFIAAPTKGNLVCLAWLLVRRDRCVLCGGKHEDIVCLYPS